MYVKFTIESLKLCVCHRPGYFTVVDIKPTLRHEADSTLGVRGLIQRQVVDVRCFIGYLIESDYTVSLDTRKTGI